MTGVIQMGTGMVWLCSFHEAFWLVWWMEKNYAPGEWQNTGHGKRFLTGRNRILLLTLGYGILWFSMRELLSGIPALLFFTISFCLLWKCEGKESFLYAAGYLFGLEVTLWFAGRLPQYGILIGQAVWLAGNLIAGRLRRHRRIQECREPLRAVSGTMGAAFFLTIFFSDFLWNMLRGERVKDYFYLACLTTVLTAAYFYAQKARMQEQMAYLDLQNGFLEQGYRKAHDFYAENAKLYHDMHHHLRAVEQMVANGEDAEALAYIADVQEPVRTAAVPVCTGVELVDTVLYEAQERAKAKNIDLQIHAYVFSGIDRIQKKDLCALFANLTENALEAAKSRIRLTTRTVPGMLLLEIENDYSEKPELTEGHFQTKKADSARHGWGLRIVEQIVKKYEGQISYEVGEETGDFRVRVWLNL